MPLDFQFKTGAAIDEESELTIYPPRLVPASPLADPALTEYQYNLYQGDDRYGFSVFGKIDQNPDADSVTLDLSQGLALEAILRLKLDIGNSDPDFVFLTGMARGLLVALEADAPDDRRMICQAWISLDALAKRHVSVVADHASVSGEGVLLASVTIAVRHVDKT